MFVGFQSHQCPPPPPTTPQYLTILMTERGGAIIFCRILAPPKFRGGGGCDPLTPPVWRPWYCICMLATGLGACSQELDHYETLVLFVIFLY